MTIEQLKALIAEGKFHHATYRTDFARGLHIYAKQDNGFNGFTPVGYFPERDDTCKEAYELTRNSGISLNAYGRG